MNGDKVWLRLPRETLDKVEALGGRENRAKTLRELIEKGLSPTPVFAPAVLDDNEGLHLQFTKSDAHAAAMAAWFLDTAARTWTMSLLPDDQPAWLVDSPIANKAEWTLWAHQLRYLSSRFKGAIKL